MNPLTAKTHTGTLGELLVQMRLLQYGVQAAPPVKDSGNDLIAVHEQEFRAVSVRTITTGLFKRPSPERFYHVLAVVELIGENDDLYLDRCGVYLIPRADVAKIRPNCRMLEQYRITSAGVRALFVE